MHHPSEERPRKNEDEYFARENAELIERMRAKLDSDRDAQERKAHYMKCPKCGADLVEREHGNVKVDICQECRGMWLDSGELDLIRHMQQQRVGQFVDDLLGMFSRRKSRPETAR
ncbi:MAG: zf-TFIIB domain-containing protein [Gemmatimonadetes bacterium]|nr:zf-TFIIB domain-containing protein [Gemmatimonadota bacterium]